MKKNLRKFYLVMLGAMIGLGAFAQCPTINCPANISLGNDSGLTTAIVNYTIPMGVDSCFADSVVFDYTGAIVQWPVPTGVTSVTITTKGAEGSYNPSSSVGAGLGAIMIGDFIITPGDTLKVLVGQQHTATLGNGGGGGSFVTDMANNPIIIAGGGGGSAESVDSPDKHGQVGTTGGTGAGGGGTGGTAGNGGNIGATFASGAGGGLLTDGADGWTTNTGGDAFVIGGAGATENNDAQGGFGGGGSGSSYVVGGGGGGYSGGGSGSNSTGAGVGGGGASYNSGTNQVNTGGANSGHGQVIVKWTMHTDTAVLVSGLGNGAAFPIGTTTEIYRYYSASGDSADCSFTVTVVSTANIEETEEINSANVYPNPSNGNFMLEMNNTEENTIQIEIHDIAGKLIYSNVLNDAYIKQQLNMEKEANGVYFLKLTSDIHTATYKLVKY